MPLVAPVVTTPVAAGLLRPDAGEVEYPGLDPQSRGRAIRWHHVKPQIGHVAQRCPPFGRESGGWAGVSVREVSGPGGRYNASAPRAGWRAR